MLPECGRPAHPVPAPLNRRMDKQTRKLFFGGHPALPQSTLLERHFPTSALEASGCLSEQRRTKGNPTDYKETKLPNPKLAHRVKAVRSHRSSLAEPECPDPCFKGVIYYVETQVQRRKRQLPQVTQQTWMPSMKCLRVGGLEL